jgi:hypothetical protein
MMAGDTGGSTMTLVATLTGFGMYWGNGAGQRRNTVLFVSENMSGGYG